MVLVGSLVTDDLSLKGADGIGSDAGEVISLEYSNSSRDAISQKIRKDLGDLRLEILLLREEVLKNRQRIIALENKKRIHGKEVRKRADSMLMLLTDYGGSLTSSSVKAYMGLSKDELYRTLKCARDEDLIEVLPDPRDRRGYILNVKADVSRRSGIYE